MVVGTTAHDAEATLDKLFCKHLGIFLNLLGPLLELRLQGLTESNSLGSNHVLQRTALLTREDCRVQQLAHHLHNTLRSLQSPGVLKVLTHQDDTTTRTAQSLVSRRSNNVSILYRVVKQTSSNQTCGVSHINHQQSTYLVGNLAHALVIPFAAVCRTTADNQFGLVLKSQLLHLVIIHTTCFLVQVVADGIVDQT